MCMLVVLRMSGHRCKLVTKLVARPSLRMVPREEQMERGPAWRAVEGCPLKGCELEVSFLTQKNCGDVVSHYYN